MLRQLDMCRWVEQLSSFLILCLRPAVFDNPTTAKDDVAGSADGSDDDDDDLFVNPNRRDYDDDDESEDEA